jgi:hypothetical protein
MLPAIRDLIMTLMYILRKHRRRDPRSVCCCSPRPVCSCPFRQQSHGSYAGHADMQHSSTGSCESGQLPSAVAFAFSLQSYSTPPPAIREISPGIPPGVGRGGAAMTKGIGRVCSEHVSIGPADPPLWGWATSSMTRIKASWFSLASRRLLSSVKDARVIRIS